MAKIIFALMYIVLVMFSFIRLYFYDTNGNWRKPKTVMILKYTWDIYLSVYIFSMLMYGALEYFILN